jgi:hypothetical protein
VLPKSLDPDTLRNVALGASLGTLVLALIVLRMVRQMVLKVVLVGALIGIGVYAWSQRTQLKECVPRCACTFVGFDVRVDAPGCTTETESPVPS